MTCSQLRITLRFSARLLKISLRIPWALEAACNHEQAQGRTLAQKLNYLAQNGRIPNTLAEMAHQLKELRNLGAHDAEDEVTENDVPIILDFLEAILEYLYVAPAKIEAVRTRLISGDSKGNE
jgi:hypothetical protein